MVAKAMSQSPLIVIVGTTASGKSKLALQLADKFQAEIISADSSNVRRYMDIGTAKPTILDREKIRHHLIDIIDPDTPYTAAVYKRDAMEIISQIRKRGKVPMLVGGTGLYIDSLIYDYSFLPAASDEYRQYLNSLELSQLYDIVDRKNLSLETIDKNNKRRVIRLIETNGAQASKKTMMDNAIVIGIKKDSIQLKTDIIARLDNMINLGLEKEVATLSNKYGWDAEGLKIIGYKEWRLYFQANQSLEEVKARIIKNTLDLSKRQDTWFKKNKSIHWFEYPLKKDNIVELIATFLNN